MSKKECCMCSDRLNYVKLCEKYDQLESVHEVLVEDNLTYENQIADLEAKLAEKEKEIELLTEEKEYIRKHKLIFEDALVNVAKSNQNKISFAVAELEKVKVLIHNAVNIDSPEYDLVGLYDAVSNQIKAIKGDEVG